MTLRNAPRSEQDGASGRFDLPDGESQIFLRMGLDRNFDQRVICPSGDEYDVIASVSEAIHLGPAKKAGLLRRNIASQ